jgi:hypothetical protein
VELVEVQQCARDQEGTMLVWTGQDASAAAPAPIQSQAPLVYTPPHLAEKILRSRRKITFPNLRYCCTILGERVPCFAWEYLGAVVRYRFHRGIETRPF